MRKAAGFSRRGVIRGSAATFGLVLAGTARAASAPMELTVQPQRVFKRADYSNEHTESWVANIIAQTSDDIALLPTRMRVDLLRGEDIAKSTVYAGAGLDALTANTATMRATLPDGTVPPRPLHWPFAVRLRNCEGVAAGIDAMSIEIAARAPDGRQRSASLIVPIGIYRQKTSLIYPFRGKGIILQAGAANGGHRNRSGQFALDGVGLTDTYAVLSAPGPGDSPLEYACWGRPLLAPANGRIVRARGDRPDQPDANKSDPKYFAPEFPNGGDPGNHLVIDHGDDEYSMIAHLQAGSLLVRAGDHVRQGDAVGKLGASGDASGPHVHYQLQSAPDWQFADGLPCKFANIHEEILARGSYFEAT